jgi:hypothetical protein
MMNKDKKVNVNKYNFSDVCLAQMMLIAIKCPLLQHSTSLEAKPKVSCCGLYFGCFAFIS